MTSTEKTIQSNQTSVIGGIAFNGAVHQYPVIANTLISYAYIGYLCDDVNSDGDKFDLASLDLSAMISEKHSSIESCTPQCLADKNFFATAASLRKADFLCSLAKENEITLDVCTLKMRAGDGDVRYKFNYNIFKALEGNSPILLIALPLFKNKSEYINALKDGSMLTRLSEMKDKLARVTYGAMLLAEETVFGEDVLGREMSSLLQDRGLSLPDGAKYVHSEVELRKMLLAVRE